MKSTLILGILLLMSSFSSTADEHSQETVINIVKQHDKVKPLLAKYLNKDYEVSFGAIEMGGHCGFVGCQWQKLVSMVITAKRANSPSITYLAMVSGNTPDRGAKPTVRFVELTDMDPAKWAVKL